MKKYVSTFLIPCFLLNISGCYYSKEILKEDYSNIMADTNATLLITLKSGITVTSNQYEHIYVEEPEEFIFGKADLIDELGVNEKIGIRLSQAEIDSLDQRLYLTHPTTICWSKGKKYSFNDHDYFYITKDSLTGFWVKGRINESEAEYYGRIDQDEIIRITAEEINKQGTIISGLGVTAIVLAAISLIALANLSIEASND